MLSDMHSLAAKHPRAGYQMITGRLRLQGWRVNRKRIARLWRQEGLKVPQKQPKRRRISQSTTVRQAALYPNHVWSWDFVFDRTSDGRALKILNIVDEYTRLNIALEVERNFTGKHVCVALGKAMLDYGIPGCIRSDNGSEFIASSVKDWLEQNGIRIMYIDPASPWQNPFVESLNGRLRDECLNRELFDSLTEAKYILNQWRTEYNTERPHSSLKWQTPLQVFQKFIPLENGTETDNLNRGYLH